MSATQQQQGLRRIVVVGDGAEAAAISVALAVSLQGSDINVSLVGRSSGQSSVGFERILGGPQSFHRQLGIDELELIRETSGVYCLGSQYTGFAARKNPVFVPLGRHGTTLRLVPFHQYWCKLHSAGSEEPYNDYSLPAVAAALGRFAPAESGDDPVRATVEYDLLVDSDLCTHFFRDIGRKLGVTVINDSVSAAVTCQDGGIGGVELASGDLLAGDFFIDCTEERLLAGALASPDDCDNWSGWLPCDRLYSVLTAKQREPLLYSAIKAVDCGWLQRNTLQNFTVVSLACSHSVDEDTAKGLLEKNLKSPALSDVEIRAFTAGSWRNPWTGNCVAAGPAAMRVEPLNVSSLQLTQNAALRLLGMLPAARHSPMLASEFNRIAMVENSGIRDYTIAHYRLALRPDSPLWVGIRNAALPEDLQRRIEFYSRSGRLDTDEHEWFAAANWISTFINFGLLPEAYDPLADMADERQVWERLQAFRESARRTAAVWQPAQ